MTGRGIVDPMPCGTVAAYQRHRRHREVIDEECSAAAAADVRRRRQWRKTRGQAEQDYDLREVIALLAEMMGYPR